jgi:dTMP kinase
MTTGFFITFEGVEGCGKTTQLRLLQECLTARGYAVTATREPGGTPIGDGIRRLVLSPGASAIDGKTELMLYEASRAQHMFEVIGPALAKGNIVLCDRFGDATLAYQGYAQGLPLDFIEALNRFTTGNRNPDFTILLDCPVELGLERTRERAARTGQDVTEDRFEKKDLDFHRRVRQGYLAIARDNSSRFVTVDGSGERDAIQATIRTAVLEKLHYR